MHCESIDKLGDRPLSQQAHGLINNVLNLWSLQDLPELFEARVRQEISFVQSNYRSVQRH